MREWHELLSRVELFAGLNPKERDLLLSAAEEKEVRRRERLLSPPAPHFLYLVTRGALKTVRSNGKENLLVDFHKPGDLLGEDCALLAGESDMLALPFDNATVLQIPAENFSKVMESQPRFGRALASMCALRAKSFRERLYFMMAAPVPVRLASVLYLLAKNFGKRDRQGVLIGLRITHQDLADYIGASRETVTLFLSKFKQDGLIIMKVRKIIIPDLKALKKVGTH